MKYTTGVPMPKFADLLARLREKGVEGYPPRGSAKSVAGCLMFGVFGVLTGVRRGPAGTIGGV